MHLTLLAGLAVCAAAFCFEIIRALDGHTFSWLYVFEWPIFASYGVYLWWHLLNGRDLAPRPNARPPGPGPRHRADDHVAPAEDDRAALEAWQRYLVDLGETGAPPPVEEERPEP